MASVTLSTVRSRPKMRVAAGLAVLAAALALALPARAEIAPEMRARIDEIASEPVTRGESPAIMIGVRSGSDRMVRAFGQTAVGSGIRPTVTTVWEIGSVTKTFTAMLLALYVQRGIVGYNDPLQKYVPDGVTVPSFEGRAIRLIDLATHTAGLPKDPPLRGARHLSDRRMYAMLSDYELTRRPGSKFEYSNWGFALLAHALMKASGQDYQQMVEREICAPLGMIDTRIELTADEAARQAQGYSPSGNPKPHTNLTWPAFNGSGALRSTMDDMMRYLGYNLGQMQTPLDSLLPELQKRWHHGGRRGTWVGLAWQMFPMHGTDHVIIWKNGAASGFFTYIGFVKDSQTGVVVLANRKAPVGRIGVRILRVLNGASLKVREPGEEEMENDEP
jgi:D-alanyl-D-alanine-carboxypeptidase/D-alanyl-D-alanine-endopeptidase